MANSDTEICNMALKRAGVSKRIDSLTEDSLEAEVCNDEYDHCRKIMLERGWSWASGVKKLSQQSGDAPIGWEYEYTYPTDAQAIHFIVDEGGGRLVSREEIHFWDERGLARYSYPFKLHARDDTLTIITDLDDAYALYTKDVDTVALFPSQFVEALAWLLASKIILPLRKDPKAAAQAKQQYFVEVSSAEANDLNQSEPDTEVDPDSIRAMR